MNAFTAAKLAALVTCAAIGVTPGSLRAQSWDGTHGTWAFAPGRDDFRQDALLDLRYLNEKVAGQSGYVAVDPQGRFRLGDGKLERFWAVNSDVGHDASTSYPRPLWPWRAPDLATHAKFLAKRGVNMVRCFLNVYPDTEKSPDSKFGDPDRGQIDACWRVVAAMRKEGIYTTISPYWVVHFKLSNSWGVDGGANQTAFGMLFYDPVMQAAYKSWLKVLLTEKNPYTGIALGKDPAVAIFEIQNEDSLLFWTIDTIKGAQRRDLGKLFGTWALRKYGSSADIRQAWAGTKLAGDDPDGGVYDFYNWWGITQHQAPGTAQRFGDQLEFCTETMRHFNAQITDFIHHDLGSKVLVNASNWRTADPIRMNDAERLSYAPTEVDAVNRYFDGVHKGPNEGWAIQNGDLFTSPSILHDPKPLPTNLKQTAGRPIIITESSWVPPMAYSAEGPFLISAYESLTGVSGYYWFATDDDEWTAPKSANGYNPGLAKWTYGTPDMLGTFPAAALMYREGYVKQASPAVEEQRSLDDMWSLRTPVISEESGYDPNRDAGDIATTSSIKSGLNPLAFLVGPVTVKLGGNPEASRAVDLSKYIDAGAGTVRSLTGQLALNYEKGYCVLDAPCAQGVTAFFAAKAMTRTSDVTFLSQNEYGAALAVSMDGKPIASSGKVLIQYGTRSRPTGWEDRPTTIKLDNGQSLEGFQVVNYGKAPWQVQDAALDVIVRNASLRKATVLDMNGNAIGPVALQKSGGGVRFTFPPHAMYVVLER